MMFGARTFHSFNRVNADSQFFRDLPSRKTKGSLEHPTRKSGAFSAGLSDLGQSCRSLLQRLAADRYVEFVHHFAVMSN
jgi:hypothetical protein